MVTREGVIAVYITTNRKNGTLYTGVTGDLPSRIEQHRTGAVRGFASRYGVDRLVWYRVHDSMIGAIASGRST